MQAASASKVVVRVAQADNALSLTFTRQVQSVATLKTPWGVQTASFTGAALFPGDPQHYWRSLKPLALKVNVPPSTAAGLYPVSVGSTLYVCDQRQHLCSVRPAQAQGQLEVGPHAAPLTLTLDVPGLRGF